MEKERINVAEILHNCPIGMELDCTMFENVTFEEIDGNNIVISRKSVVSKVYLTQYGKLNSIDGKCVIFPKGKTSWEDFVPPCVFNDGDVVFTTIGNFAIISNKTSEGIYSAHCIAFDWGNFTTDKISVQPKRLATQSEKQGLFDTIKANGYRWNEETKTLEKLIIPKFKVGDVVHKDSYKVKIIDVCVENKAYGYESVIARGIGGIWFEDQDEWELVPDKFDINTLKPFDKVLVRDTNEQVWVADFFSHKVEKQLGVYTFACVGHYPDQCIPYEQNKYLLGTTNDCNEFYKTWGV